MSKKWKRTISFILSATIVCSIGNVSALAEKLKLPENDTMVQSTESESLAEKVCICDPKVEGGTGHTNKDCPFYQEENTEEKVCICDPKVEGEIGHTNKDCPFYQEENTEEKVCICDPKVEGEIGHTNKDCPFYQEENTEEKVCICDPKVEGETGHTNKDCPFYQEENTDEIEEAKVLIEKLPSLEEINRWKPTLELTEEDEGYQEAYDAAISAHREELRKQIQEARAAYDVLDEEQKKAFDQGLLSKLTSLETKLSQPVIDMESRLSALPSVEEFQNWKPILDIPENAPGYQAAYDAAVAAQRKEVEEQVNAVREAYDVLTSEQQAVLDPALVKKFTALEAVLLPALMPVADPKAVYISNAGSDEDNQGNGSKEKPYASLAKAVDKVENGGTIYVMSNLTSTECARIVDKSITITSGDGGPYIISRGAGFETISDNARSWYNPAMIEVTTPNGQGASLTLSNIILDDVGKYEGTIFAQATGTDDTRYVQDAIVAAYGLDSVTASIILEQGAVLKNFGGMSAVRVTGGAELTMRSGSKICDDTVTDRIKGETGSNGPAGAVWVQGTNATMEAGAEISNMFGRAFYVDGGSAKIGGSIHDITGDKDMWQGTKGIAIHARGDSKVTLSSGGQITAIQFAKDESDTAVATYGSDFTMDQGSEIFDLKNIMAIYADDQNNNYTHEMLINGTIRDCTTTGFLARSWYGLITIGPEGLITKNKASQVLYTHNGSKYTIEGKLLNNTGTALYLANQGGSRVTAEMTGDNAEISGTTGVAVRVNNGSLFTMDGGVIKENSTGVQVSGKQNFEGVEFVMNGGSIENNNTGISYTIAGQSKVQLNGGTIQNNGTSYQISAIGGSAQDVYENIYINKGVLLGNQTINTSFGKVVLDEAYSGVWLGKASETAKDKLTDLVAEDQEHKNWKPVSSSALWFKADAESYHFRLDRSGNDRLGMYLAYIPLNVDGTPKDDAKLTLQEVQSKDIVDITLTDLERNTAYAIMLFNTDTYQIQATDLTIYTGEKNYQDGLPDNFTISGVGRIETIKIGENEEQKYKKWNSEEQAKAQQDLKNLFTISYQKADGSNLANDQTPGEYFIVLTRKNPSAGELKINDNKVNLVKGRLVIRHIDEVSDVISGKNVNVLLDTAPTEKLTKYAQAVKTGNIYYTNNDSKREIMDTSGISLLDDGLLTSENDRYRELMEQRGNKIIQWEKPQPGMVNHYDWHYLDLVDQNNGNAWVSSQNEIAVYLPYPDGTDKTTDFKLLHYQDLHREYGIAGQADVETAIQNTGIEEITFTKEDVGIKFMIPRSGFSPFALVWQGEVFPTPDPDEPNKPNPPEGGKNDNSTNTGDEDGRMPYVNTENIKDEDIPRDDIPEDNNTTIDDSEVTLKPVPDTGDMIPVVAIAMAALSLGSVLMISNKKK